MSNFERAEPRRELIVFEGIDNSGKTTISKEFTKYLSNSTKKPWTWTKEPDFTTEEADRLNAGGMDEYKREALFLESRNRRQQHYEQFDTVLDRYLWTGLAYAKKFSPNCYEFSKAIYSGVLFKKPDLYIFMDTPVEVCLEREPEVGLDRLKDIRQAYLDTSAFIPQPIITVIPENTIEETVQKVIKAYEDFYKELYKEL